MSTIIERFNKIKLNISKVSNADSVKIVAVSKTFSLDHIMPLIDHGHTHYGENKVQEADIKWTNIRKERTNLKLHLIGKLQSNKAKKAAEIFDYIHSLDSQKLADILSKNEKELNKSINYFIQVNIGNENQKSGINKEKLKDFQKFCKNLNLDIIGTMCIPPNNGNTENFFFEMSNINQKLNFKELSMGMSGDYLEAIKNSATYVRVGSKIFGSRT